MKSYQKESRKINLLNKQKHHINKPLYRIGRLKSQDDINKNERIDRNILYKKDISSPSNIVFPPNLLKKTPNQKTDKLSVTDIVNKKGILNNIHTSYMNFNMTSLNKNLFQKDSVNFEQDIHDIGKISLTNNIYDDIKIRNIITLWNELEVSMSYRKSFFFVYKELDKEDKKNYYQNEIKELIELKNDIKSLTYNIELRIGIIKKLSELNNELNNRIDSINKNNKVDKFIINEMIKELEDLSIQTVNIVRYMKKIKTIINMAPNLSKYDINIISQKFNFDKNYIIKMKFETNFLREGSAKMLFNIKNDHTPFFVKACDKTSKSNQDNNEMMHVIKLEPKIIKDIKECNYYIYKELIAYENEKSKHKEIRRISPIKKNSTAYNFFTNVSFYKHEFNKNKENKKDKLCLNLKISNNRMNLNKINNNNFLINKRDSIDDINANNSAKLVQSFDFLNKNNINSDNQLISLDVKKNENNLKQKNKNGDFINFQSEFNKNNLSNPISNKTDMILPRDSESFKSSQKNLYLNEGNIPQNNNYDTAKINNK